MPINGQTFDWESLTVNLPSGPAIGLKEISYDAEQEVEPVYGKGGIPRGYGHGNYKSSGSFTLLLTDSRALEQALFDRSAGKGVLKGPPFPITCAYANADQDTTRHELPAVKVTKVGNATKQGDKESVVKWDFINLEPVKRNDAPDAADPAF